MTQPLAIDGGTPVRTKPFPEWPQFDQREEQALLRVLHSRNWGVHVGTQVTAFEKKFAEFQHARFGVGVPNGTLALEMALRALGIQPGDEVITTPYTFIATSNVILLLGAKPVYVDIEPTSWNLDPTKIESAITAKTKAIMPVHLAGRPANMDVILDIARRHNVRVIEDACQAWGAEWRGQRVGALGDLGAFSFQASKNITAGEGGIVVTNDAALAEFCWSYHTVGRTRTGAWYEHEIVGTNYRMAEWEGALLLVQLERYPAHVPVREANARYLAQLLAQVGGLDALPDDPRVTQHARHLFIAEYAASAFGGHPRREFLDALRAEGIGACSPGYIPLYRTNAIKRARADMFNETTLPDCPVTEHAAERAVWLFQYVLLGDRQDMESIAEAVSKIKRAWA
ncbi:MAG: DegT/DnrJ/EryC1/StrS family aminotransferase [Chloroflexi bacterium]|nr:DegT/DnrJ/EryC1/StrS family aminotransferase [Chloroflexota bacterium]